MEHERILHILDYMTRCTDEEHPVTLRNIQHYLEHETNMGSVSILTLRRDMERLELSGNPLATRKGPHNTTLYYLPTKGFTFNEIRFLVDSVSINQFISDSRKQQLIRKFESLCSDAQVRQLISRVKLNNTGLSPTNLLENLEQVHKIIAERRKIDFDYGKFNTEKQVTYYSKKRDIVPCQVIYFDNRFYLKCIHADTRTVRTYRIDRMRKIREGEIVHISRTLPKPDGYVLDIFEPETFTNVTLRVAGFLLDDMLETFGQYAHIKEDSQKSGWVVISVRIGISQSFYRWVMRYGENIEVLSPANLRDGMRETISHIAAMYQEGNVQE